MPFAATETIGGDHLDELSFRDSYVLIGCKGWAPSTAYEPVPESSVITVSCSFDVLKPIISEVTFNETETICLTSPETHDFLTRQSLTVRMNESSMANKYNTVGIYRAQSSDVVEKIATSLVHSQPLLSAEQDEEYQSYVEALSKLIEGSTQFKSVAMALQRADDFPADQEAFQAGQNALKTVWQQTLLNANLGGVNEMNMTLLRKIFKFEQGILVMDPITNQPIFAEDSSNLITDVIDDVLAAAAADRNSVPETETLRIMRSAFGQSDAKKIQSELAVVSSLDSKLRLALADKIGSAKDTLSKVMDGGLAAHIQLQNELQRKLSSAEESVNRKKAEKDEILSNIDHINQVFGDILGRDSELNLDALVEAVDPGFGLNVALDAIEEYLKQRCKIQKGKLGEVELLDELKSQLQIFTECVNVKERVIIQEQQRIESLKHTIAICETNITSLNSDHAAASTKLAEANIDLENHKLRQDVLKQVLKDNNDVTNTKTVRGEVFKRLRSSVSGAADKVDQLRTACIDHANKKIILIKATNHVDELKRNRQYLFQEVQNAERDHHWAAQNENSKRHEYNNEADKVTDGKRTQDNPNKMVKRAQYEEAKRHRQCKENDLKSSRNKQEQNDRAFVQSNDNKAKAEKDLDNSVSRISDLCREIQSMINSQNVEAIKAESVAKSNVAAFQGQIDDAVSSMATNTAKKTDASDSLSNAANELQRATELLRIYNAKLEDISQQISSVEVNIQTPIPVSSLTNEEAEKSKANMLIAEREAASKKLQAINEQLFVQHQYISKVTNDLESERQLIAYLKDDTTAVAAAILEAEQICKRDIDHLVADFNEQMNANIAVAGFSTFAAWITDRDTRGQSLLRCLVSHVRNHLRPYRIGDDSDVMFATCDISEVQKSSVENLVTKLQKNNPSCEVNGSITYDLAAALINEEFSADPNYQQISVLEVRASTNNSESASVFFKSMLKRPSANVLLYDASDLLRSDFVELRPLSTSEAIDAVEFLKTLSRYASSEWSLNSLAIFLANLLLRKPVSEASIEEMGENIRTMQAMHGNVELTANLLQEAIKPAFVENENPSSTLDPVTQLSLRLLDRLFCTRTAIIQAENSHIDSTSDELIQLATGINTALRSFVDKLSRKAMHFLQNEILRRRDAILSGSESSLGGETADRVYELNSAIDRENAALESKKADLRKLESLMDNKEKQNARVAEVANELKKIQEGIDKLSNINIEKRAELSKLRANLSNVNTEKETLLNDIQSRQDEIAKLKSERSSVERKLSRARDAADEAAKLCNAAQVEAKTLQAKLETTQRLLEDSKTELEDMARWSAFANTVRDAINNDFDVIRIRPKLAQEYQDVRRGNTNAVFSWLSRSLPKLSAEANYWESRKNALWANDLCSKVLDDKLYNNPNLALQIGVAFTISGPSLSYSEASQLLRGWAVARLEPLGLALDEDDKVYVKVPEVVPGLFKTAMPEPLKAFFSNRIKRFYQHKQDKPPSNAVKHWNDFLCASGLDLVKYYTEMVEWCPSFGANLMDILLAFSPTVEILTGFNFLIDNDVKLPGMNFYVTCAGEVKVDDDVTIDTSAAEQPNLRHNKARDGFAYRPNTGLPNGRDGDDGLDGPAGFNGGHVTIRAHGSIVGGGVITVKTHGEKGHDGQIGGDGDEGHKGFNVPNAEAPDTSPWYRNMTVGISRYPGQDENRKFPPEGGYPNEISGEWW